ncbi:MAG TPA: hypothetical protein VIX19_03515 [Terriglobales bacterium]
MLPGIRLVDSRNGHLLYAVTIMRVTGKSELLPAAALLLAALCLAGCTTRTPIADINRDPGRFAGKEITVEGRASNAFGGFGSGVFQVEDATGSIWVLSQNFGLPGNGTEVSVTGEVEQGLSFGGRNYGTMIRQTKAFRR